MSRTIAMGLLTIALLLAVAVDGRAQFQGSGGSGGVSSTGSSSFGSTGYNPGNFGSTGFGSTNLGNSGGFGSIGLGTGSSSFGSGFGSSGFGSQSTGTTGFGQGNQQFVGRDASDMQSVFNNLGRNSNQFFQQLNRSMGAGRGRQSNQQPENARPPVRVQLHVAFDYDRPTATVVAQGLQNRLVKILAEHEVQGAEVSMDGHTATLHGTAANESQRLVLENLVRLEPGVSAVVNQMTLASTTPPADPESDN